MAPARALTSQTADFPRWYGEVVRRADLAEHSLVRGAISWKASRRKSRS